ncbi:hypothetical protein PBY51_006971 [Eleginops maclovinus]|uniref:Metalloendopeptidase n=2 Tax=Eleginops maclovinus TaxID=56733 RepID=A0AAN7WW51_ELEMC|nr:hypothetical protein PBY51_006971 [Eleginops maclovinus]
MVSLLLLLLLGLCNAHDGSDHGADSEILKDQSDTEDISTTILRMNNGSSELILEGDLMIPRTRNAMKCISKRYNCLWPKSANGNVEVPYILSSKYDQSEKNTIVNAMKDIEYNTCVRYVPRARQTAYLDIEPRYGCATTPGYLGDKQTVSLQRFGCISHGIIQHELLHTLGFYHEHTRSDRNQYVKINWDNVIEFFKPQFRQMDTKNLNTSYDYTSIMHYARRSLGKFNSETITPIPDASVPIGKSRRLSDIDIVRINRLYKCWRYL